MLENTEQDSTKENVVEVSDQPTSTIEYLKQVKYLTEPSIIKSIYASSLSGLVNDLLNGVGTLSKKRILSKEEHEMMQFGVWYESMLVSHYKKAGILKYPDREDQISIQEGIVKGKLDALVVLNGKDVIVECKTVKFMPETPKTEHLYQLGFYVAYYPCSYGILHYADYNRNIQEFVITKDHPIIARVKEKVDTINTLYNANEKTVDVSINFKGFK